MLFSRSDKIKELVGNHTDAVLSCFSAYISAMADVLKDCDGATIATHTKELKAQESKADLIRRQIIRQLLEGGLVIDSRKSIMHVIEAVDEVADLAEDIIKEIYIQNIHLPTYARGPIESINTITLQQLGLLEGIVKSVVDKYKASEMTQIILEIEGLESAIDDLQEKLVKEIFEKDLQLAEKMQLRQLINMIGGISDLIEDISDEIEIIMMARKV